MHCGVVVVAIGIYVGNPVPDAAVFSTGGLSCLPSAARPRELNAVAIRTILETASEHLGRPADRVVVSYPSGWDSLRIDRLLRDLRAADVAVNRYLTSGEAVARWWRHLRGGVDERRDGTLLIHDVGEAPSVTVVRVDGLRTETLALSDVSEFDAVLLMGTDDRRPSVADELHSTFGMPVVLVGTGQHAVAFGAALAATL